MIKNLLKSNVYFYCSISSGLWIYILLECYVLKIMWTFTNLNMKFGWKKDVRLLKSSGCLGWNNYWHGRDIGIIGIEREATQYMAICCIPRISRITVKKYKIESIK